MKRLLTILPLCWLVSTVMAAPTQVRFSFLDGAGNPLSAQITLTPTATNNVLQNGGSMIIGAKSLTTNVPGTLVVPVMPNNYLLVVAGTGKSYLMQVMDTNVVMDATALMTSLPTYTYTNRYGLPVTALLAGTNIWLSGSNGVVTIASTGGGGTANGITNGQSGVVLLNQTNNQITITNAGVAMALGADGLRLNGAPVVESSHGATLLYDSSGLLIGTDRGAIDIGDNPARAVTITGPVTANLAGSYGLPWSALPGGVLTNAVTAISSNLVYQATNSLYLSLPVTNWPGTTSALVVSGAPGGIANGTYYWNGTRFINGNGTIRYSGGAWRISWPSAGGVLYQNNTTDPTGTWTAVAGGVPVPTVQYATGALAFAVSPVQLNGQLITNLDAGQLNGQIALASLPWQAVQFDTSTNLTVGQSTVLSAGAVNASDATKRSLGSGYSATLPMVSGSAAGLYDLPAGPQLWRLNPMPMIMMSTMDWLTNATSANVSNNIWVASHSGVVAALAQYGCKPWAFWDTDWGWQARDGGGNLLANPVRCPTGIATLAAQAHAAGMRFWLNQYYWPDPSPTTFYSSIDGTQFNPVNYAVAATSPNTIAADVATFYAWGVDGIRASDINPLSIGEALYARQACRQFADAMLVTNGFPAAGMVLQWIGGGGNRLMPASIAWEANSFGMDQGAPGNNTPAFPSYMTNAYWAWQNGWAAAAGKGHSMCDSLAIWDGSGTISTNNWRGALSLCSLWGTQLWLMTNNFNPASALGTMELASVTNANFLHCYLDPMQSPGWLAGDNGSNTVWVKRLASGDYSVCLGNMGNVATNVTVTWAMFTPPASFAPIQPVPPFTGTTNDVMNVTEVWSGTNAGTASRSLSVTVNPLTVAHVILTPQGYLVAATNAATAATNALASSAFTGNALTATNLDARATDPTWGSFGPQFYRTNLHPAVSAWAVVVDGAMGGLITGSGFIGRGDGLTNAAGYALAALNDCTNAAAGATNGLNTGLVAKLQGATNSTTLSSQLGLGSAAYTASSAYDTSGAASAAAAAGVLASQNATNGLNATAFTGVAGALLYYQPATNGGPVTNLSAVSTPQIVSGSITNTNNVGIGGNMTVAGTITGNGGGVTNTPFILRATIYASLGGGSVYYCGMNGQYADSLGNGTLEWKAMQKITGPGPTGFYVSNIVCTCLSWAGTLPAANTVTNLVLTLQTNSAPSSTGAATLMTATLTPTAAIPSVSYGAAASAVWCTNGTFLDWKYSSANGCPGVSIWEFEAQCWAR